MAERYREAGKNELSVNCIQKENRLPKERVSSPSLDRSKQREAEKTTGQDSYEGHRYL